VIETRAKLRDSPPKPATEVIKYTRVKDKLAEARKEIKFLKERNEVLGTIIKSRVAEIEGECNQLQRNIKRKALQQRRQLINKYKHNLRLRAKNKDLNEDLYIAKNLLNKGNL